MAEAEEQPEKNAPAPMPADGEDPAAGPAAKEPEPAPGNDEAADPATRSLSRALATSFGLLKLVMLVLLAFFLLDCIQVIEEGNVGLKQRFGTYVRDQEGVRRYEPGSFVFVWPFPIEELHTVSLKTETLTLDTEFLPLDDQRKKITRDTQLAPLESLDPAKNGYHITGDLNIAHSSWEIEYKIINPARYLAAAVAIPGETVRETVSKLLRATATSVILRVLAGISMDEARTAGNLPERIRREIQRELLDREGQPRWGIEVTAINMLGPFPPGITKAAFDAVIGDLNKKNKRIDEARRERNQILADADTEANALIIEAEKYRVSMVGKTRVDAKIMAKLLERFAGDPDGLHVYLQQMRNDIIQDVLRKGNLYFLPDTSQGMIILGPTLKESLGGSGLEQK